MRILDLYCGAGGASKGYSDAGFEIVGVDYKLQKKYPFEFYQDDAIHFLMKNGEKFDIIVASPPCQIYSKSASQWKNKKEYPDLIDITRQEILKFNVPYVIENVPNSPLINPIFLNGYMFGKFVHRPRYFECNFFVKQPEIKKKNYHW